MTKGLDELVEWLVGEVAFFGDGESSQSSFTLLRSVLHAAMGKEKKEQKSPVCAACSVMQILHVQCSLRGSRGKYLKPHGAQRCASRELHYFSTNIDPLFQAVQYQISSH